MSLRESSRAPRRAPAGSRLWIPAAAAAVLVTAYPAAADFDPVDPQLGNVTFTQLPAPKLIVSASNTNPFLQTAPPFSGLFNLHLWWIDPGLHEMSAIHLGIMHTFTLVAGFTSAVPILGLSDGGGGADLRLLMNGCIPDESEPPPLLLGSWTFFATGSGRGIVCLRENQFSNTLGYANCELPLPDRQTRIVKRNFRNDFTIWCPDRIWHDYLVS